MKSGTTNHIICIYVMNNQSLVGLELISLNWIIQPDREVKGKGQCKMVGVIS